VILAGSTAFWDAYLRDDAAAKRWLANGDFAAALGTDGVFEQKPGAAQRQRAVSPVDTSV